MTDEKLLAAINRLATRIVNELGGQEACDRLEAELVELKARAGLLEWKPASRKTERTST